MTKPHICTERLLPHSIFAYRPPPLMARGFKLEAVALKGKEWINGSTLHVRFIGGTPSQHNAVINEVMSWSNICNIRFVFDGAPRAEIRVAFDEDNGAWSYVGTDCRQIPLDQPTMNLGWLDDGVITHEFFHALGMGHEHQNPIGGLLWNAPQVFSDLSGPPNHWGEWAIRHNVINKYSADQIRGTEFDPDSIMLYWFPASWTTNGVGTKRNHVPSIMDKEFLGKVMYPLLAVTPPEPNAVPAVRLPINSWFRHSAIIGQPGEEDLYDFSAMDGGRYTINTSGNTNVAMRLYGPSNQTALIAEDDDSGIKGNAQIIRALAPGRYWVQIRHSDRSPGTGKYTIKVTYSA